MSFRHATRLCAVTPACRTGRYFGVQARDTDTQRRRTYAAGH